MRNLFFVLVILGLHSALGAEVKQGEQQIIYKYKQFEKFDFDEIGVEGDKGIPGDLSILPRYQKYFKNRLPYRKNFNPEIRKSVERVL
ncbi:MAG: hypothetical protein A2X86_09820 [Bdellovibrionales bacterium GWA2_49_15]|nr:MAG: hypothetical protein A2X86_09820 [Bdellovibrionales bacterium GWA2_49_15]HAZ13080.1 hypothetical protein [Bdellovibrionales bacterium]